MIRQLLAYSICFCMCVQIAHAQVSASSAEEGAAGDADDSSRVIHYFSPELKGSSKVSLAWDADRHDLDFFTIERSCNGRDYEVIAVLKQSPGTTHYSFIDDAPVKGKNLYRVRTSIKGGPVVYSEAISVLIASNVAFRLYPNPADNILIIRAEMPVRVQIIDASGNTRIIQERVTGLQTINVSTLEKGIYIVRISDHQSNLLMQEKLLKN